MLLKILNYSIRGITVIAGILFAAGVLTPDLPDPALPRVLGAVLILFGIYRLLLFHFQQQRRRDDEEE